MAVPSLLHGSECWTLTKKTAVTNWSYWKEDSEACGMLSRNRPNNEWRYQTGTKNCISNLHEKRKWMSTLVQVLWTRLKNVNWPNSLEAIWLPPRRKKGERPTIKKMEGPIQLTLGSGQAKRPSPCKDDNKCSVITWSWSYMPSRTIWNSWCWQFETLSFLLFYTFILKPQWTLLLILYNKMAKVLLKKRKIVE